MARRSDARVSVLAVLALGASLSFLSFVTPNWLASDTRLYGAEFVKLGLWETCFRSFRGPHDFEYRKYFAGCRWIFREEYQTIRSFLLPAFFIATQVLYTIGFVFLLVAVIGTLAIELCFITDREAFAMRILSTIMFLAGLFCTIAVIIFGIRGDDRDWMPDPEHNFLSWSFALAVVACFCHWIAAVLFLVESRILYKRELKREQHSFSLEPTGIKG